jgi:RNA polymerase sigma-70 factor (ECF subfamily)
MSMVFDVPDLIVHARNGNDAALGELLASYADYLGLLARVQIGRRLRGKVDADDILQETFLEAHRQFPRFAGQSEGELAVWLRRILLGQVALVLRRFFGTRQRNIELERELIGNLDQPRADDGALVADCSSPSDHASRSEQAVLLAAALAKLPENYREVIILRHLEGLSFPEVSKKMARSEDSVQKLWVRALACLRRSLGEIDGPQRDN